MTDSDPTGDDASGDVVRWWGHSVASIELSGTHLVTDPLLRRWVGPLRWYGPLPPAPDLRGADAVLISHLHRDHLDLPSLATFDAHTTIVVPRGAGALVTGAVHGPVIEVAAGDTLTVGAVTVQVVPSQHPRSRDALRRKQQAQPVGYVMSGDRSVYFAGDTERFEAMQDLPVGIDLALIPVGGWGLTHGPGHMNATEASEALRVIKPRLAVPIHWGILRVPLLWRTRPHLYTGPGPRLVDAARSLPDTAVILADPGTPIPL